MKKNISINIGGIIFHIEEDSYERLNQYLTSINGYFESFDDSKEIIDDIENRIAEIFLSKLNDSKQVIVDEDINELIHTMGTVADFEAQIETDDLDKESTTPPKVEEEAQSNTDEEKTTESTTQQKRLYRNNKQRILGGVASGIAHYFSIDPLWVRLLFLLVFFNILFPAITGAIFLAYLVLWIVVPGNDDLVEEKGYKKLYRNPDDRVIGGVSGGIASFFGSDPTVIRLLFVLSIFLGGAGLVLYLILWIITPEAKTITEKMQMQGEPVTLSNIESNVKKSFKVREGEESVLVKVLLFPFRLIALIFSTLGKFLGPVLGFLVDAIRIIFGMMVIALGASMMLSLLIIWAVIIGAAEGWSEYVILSDLPIEMFLNSVNFLTATALLISLFIPSLALVLLGAMIIVRRKVGSSYLGWSLFGVWIISLVFAFIMIPQIVGNYTSSQDHREERELIVADSGQIPTLRLNPAMNYSKYDGVDLKLRGHSDSTYKAVIRYEARGKNRQDALANAESQNYQIEYKEGDWYFDEELELEEDFYFQTADVIFYIPFGQKFRMEYELEEILINTLHLSGYRSYQMEGNDWTFDKSGIKCLTCPGDEEDDFESYIRPDNKSRNWSNVDGETISYQFEDFEAINITGLYYIEIEQGDDYQVEIKGRDATEVNFSKIGDELEVRHNENWDLWDQNRDGPIELYLYIQLPELTDLTITGGSKGYIKDFRGNDLELNLNGASDIDIDINTDRLDINLTGASMLRLEGRTNYLDARLDGASSLKSFELRTRSAEIITNGASKSEVYVTEDLDAKASGVSKIIYRGDARVSSQKDGLSTIKRD